MSAMPGEGLVLHGYWRSGTSYRTRIALGLKGLDVPQVAHDLRCGAQRAPEYRALQPQGLVPALETPEGVLIQSGAILEWLEERYPDPPLLPHASHARAVVRGMAALIGCDIHPLNNLRVLQHLRTALDADEAGVSAWIGRWITEGFAALEGLVARHGQGYCFGDRIGLADCYLVPQVYSARRFGVDLEAFPNVCAACARAQEHPAVAQAHPDNQPDAD